MNEKLVAFDRLLNIMDELREKCPWDKKQTMQSLRHLTIEETYELTDAIIENDLDEVKKELGDLMLHLVFYAKIASETNTFDISDVLNSICEKLIHRHPHIYGDVKVTDEEDVKKNWEKLKLKEGKKSVLEGVPKSLPALVKAIRIQDKAKGIGFDWDNIDDVFAKLHEEIDEVLYEVKQESVDENKVRDEMGDLLFAVVNLARHLGVEPEQALRQANHKFERRFRGVEAYAQADGRLMTEHTLTELDGYWDKVKLDEANK